MKKLGLCLLPLLLVGCNNKENQNQVVQTGKYSKVNTYNNVSYWFDEQVRCNVHFISYNEDGTINQEKEWCVYLSGYYFEDKDYNYNTFYECVGAYSTDYYLYVIG